MNVVPFIFGGRIGRRSGPGPGRVAMWSGLLAISTKRIAPRERGQVTLSRSEESERWINCTALVVDIAQDVIMARAGDLDGDGDDELVMVHDNGFVVVLRRAVSRAGIAGRPRAESTQVSCFF
ncbi:hypothetical protein DB30_04690 [Enhygromyxa salina]|uniref:FG-GAP repeat protein n=1 Tax=Enhygromyxa salina TaxID=215803 RepID=A0A0C2DCV0_9BACT|nr:hypothetical protein [Enhygromyxa salina]KIG19225.1 hypothetical protein DB30_04690 [Enhygromyxa salina]